MTDFMELCKSRQSCRSFADKPVEHEKLVQCIEAARLAPSGCNSQPWSFVVVEDPSIVPQVAQATVRLGINEYMKSAKAFIIAFEEHAVLMPQVRSICDSQIFAQGDVGAAVVTICYEAQSLGLGSCIIGLYDKEKLCELLDISEDKKFACLIALGYPTDNTTRKKSRKALEEIVRFV
jgi:nitroreductase